MSKRALRISQVGLRGIVGSGVTASRVMDFSAAFATFLEAPGPVIVGRDPRASGVMMREGVVAALLACGRDVVDLGIVSTPVIQANIRTRNAAGGVSIGASHNAAEWNALKFLGSGGTYLSTAEANELLDIYHLRHFQFVEWDKLGKRSDDATALDTYLDELAEVFDFGTLRKFRVVVDCSNGTSAPILRRLNERFGFAFILINATTDGSFAHEPSTSARAVEMQLAPLIKPLDADAGFLFDADSDRVALATERGQAISEEMVLALAADHLMSQSPGKLLITNLSTTSLLEDIAARYGGSVVRVPVGRNAAIDALSAYRPDQVALAGEGTGAVMMPQFRFVYDGIATMLTLLEMRAARSVPFSDMLASYPPFVMLKGEVPLSRQRIPEMLQALQEHFQPAKPHTMDGLRMDWNHQWFHVRVSQTEPIVRVIAERRDAAPTDLFRDVMEIVETYA
jgi:phosphomannomutase